MLKDLINFRSKNLFHFHIFDSHIFSHFIFMISNIYRKIQPKIKIYYKNLNKVEISLPYFVEKKK